MPDEPAPRRRRRAVGPPGARPAQEPALDLREEPPPSPADAERYRTEQPPHHDRGV